MRKRMIRQKLATCVGELSHKLCYDGQARDELPGETPRTVEVNCLRIMVCLFRCAQIISNLCVIYVRWLMFQESGSINIAIAVILVHQPLQLENRCGGNSWLDFFSIGWPWEFNQSNGYFRHGHPLVLLLLLLLFAPTVLFPYLYHLLVHQCRGVTWHLWVKTVIPIEMSRTVHGCAAGRYNNNLEASKQRIASIRGLVQSMRRSGSSNAKEKRLDGSGKCKCSNNFNIF